MSTVIARLKAHLLDEKHRRDITELEIASQTSKEAAENVSADIENIKVLASKKINSIKTQTNMKINIEDIKYRYKLLKELYQTNQISIPVLAGELDIKQTDLMQFILSNREYFAITVPVTGKGLDIARIYDKLEENPVTEEWLQKKIKDNAKTIWLYPIKEFNNIMGWRLAQTTTDPDPTVFPNFNRATKWKNTKEKVAEVKKLGYLHKQQFYFGPYNERKSEIVDDAILDAERNDIVEKFKNVGWKVIFEK